MNGGDSQEEIKRLRLEVSMNPPEDYFCWKHDARALLII